MLDNLEAEPNEVAEESSELLNEPTEQHDEAHTEEGESVQDEFFQIGEEEVPLSQIEEWRKGHMMQSDYTRKTQELAEQRKAFEAQRDQSVAKAGELTALADELEAELTKEVEAIDWDDYTVGEAKKKEAEIKAKQDRIAKARQKAATAKQEVSQEQVIKERQKLFAANPDWLENGQVTDKFRQDSQAISSYLSSAGMSADEINGITDHRVLLMARDAARYKASKTKAAEVEKKVAKAPKVTKPRKGLSSVEIQYQNAVKRLKETGSDKDYMAVQKLKKLRGN